jgi:YVTN family beta-propeller protein
MRVGRLGRFAAMVFLILFWAGCGQVYRPVVIPCSVGGVPGCPVETNPTPANFHAVFGLSTNIANYPGAAMQIDVAGDSLIGETPANQPSAPNLGDNPTHMATLPNNSRVFVASAGSALPVTGGQCGVAAGCDIDVVSSFTPAFQSTLATGLGAVNTINLPTGSQPVFLNTTQNNELFVANFGTNSLSAINTNTDSVINTVPVGINPVSLAETPNAFKVYVANQGDNTVSTLSPVDLSNNTQNGLVSGFDGMTPVWVVARGDSQKVYVLTQGDGQLVTIDVATDTVTSSLSVGVGANFMFYDPNLNRIYVPNPATGTVSVFSTSGGANDTPSLLAPPLAIPGLSGATMPACATCGPVIPVSVTALLDGSRFYVASYQIAATCPDPNVTVSPCFIPSVTVFDANSLALKYPTATSSNPTLPTMLLLTAPPFAVNSASQYQYAVPPVTSCAAPPLYSPTSTRFRVFTVASEDSSRVYVSMCDAGAIAVINTTNSNTNNTGTPLPPDSLVANLPAAYSAGPAVANGFPAFQNATFLLMGQ